MSSYFNKTLRYCDKKQLIISATIKESLNDDVTFSINHDNQTSLREAPMCMLSHRAFYS